MAGMRHLPVIDAHHHLLDRPRPAFAEIMDGVERFLVDDLEAALDPALNMVATVVVEGHSMYRRDAASAFQPVGETEFLNGQAAMGASGLYGRCHAAAAIVAKTDLTLGDLVEDVLDAHCAAAPDRLRGIRHGAAWDPDPSIVGHLFKGGPQLYLSEAFQTGAKRLAARGLSLDAFVLSPQIGDVTTLARAVPNLRIVLCHAGLPVGVGRFSGRIKEHFLEWREAMRMLAECDNVAVKLGGLGCFINGFDSYRAEPRMPPEALSLDWAPYMHETIAMFGADRCMLESNYPVDAGSGDYRTIWRAHQIIVSGYSQDERAALFAGTAARVYRLDLDALCAAGEMSR